MSRKNILGILLQLIFLVIFNVSFFAVGGVEHYTSVWISYGFIHFAYSMLLLVPRLIRKGKSSAVFGFSLYKISGTYFFIQLVIGMVFIVLSLPTHIIPLLVQFFIAGMYGVVLLLHMIANETTAKAEKKRQYQIEYVKDASAKLKILLDRITDKEVKKTIERVYDAVYSSPVKSHPELMQIENHILQYINELEDIVSTGNKSKIVSLANTVLNMVNERNTSLRKYH